MDTNRTFGIEFEVCSKINSYALKTKLKAAFAQNDLAHYVSVEGYGHSTDSSNRDKWILKNDCSISCINANQGFSHGIEAVSPVLKGKAGLRAVKIVADVLNEYSKVNRSCGLHVHHGVNLDEMKNICDAWFKVEPTIMSCLPQSRQNNQYCRTWKKKLGVHASSGMTAYNRNRLSHDRYVTLNLASFTMRSTVEFRCAAATTEASKATNWILVTQGIVDAAQRTIPETIGNITEVRSFIAGVSSATSTKTFRSNVRKTAFDMIETGLYTPKQIIEALVSIGSSPKTAKTVIYDSRNEKYTAFGQTTKITDKRIHFISSTDADYTSAGAWLETRFNTFQNAA